MERKLFFRFSFAAIVVLLTSAFVVGQGIGDRNRPQGLGSYRITGKIYLPDGRPAPNIPVNVVGTETPSSTIRTDDEGEFEVSGLGGGNYTVTVHTAGFRNENELVHIEGGGPDQRFSVVFHLKLATEANPILKDVPKNAVAQYEKGLEKATKNDMKGAIADFDTAIATYPNFAAAYYEDGAAKLKLNDLDGALESFVKAITIKPDYVDAKYGYGLVEFQKKNYEVAAAAFNDVIQQRKDMAEAHLNLGISLFYLKNVNASETELKTAITTQGGEKLAMAHLYLGQIYSQKKQNADAVKELETFLQMVPKAPNADRIKQAIEQLKKS
jgi:tetratricopeptide (TPR) repeat protein